MNIAESIEEVRIHVRASRVVGAGVAFVPTMGALHDGHLALVRAAHARAEYVVASIFVNPTQFAPGEDLATYPRDLVGDGNKLEHAGCDLLFVPDAASIYPDGFATSVVVAGIAERYEGSARPGHFRGVATVVAKLFNIVAPDVAVFGQKDAQQVAVIRRMIADLDLPIEMEVVPTVRDADGLAMSSRNVRLSDAERADALSISRGLDAARISIAAGAGIADAERAMRAALSAAVVLDYADIINSETFEAARSRAEPLLAVIAGRVGATRLIDNMPLVPTP